MSRPRILEPQASYTFSKYFELAFDAEDVFAELECGFERVALDLPLFTGPIDFANDLHDRLQMALKVTNLMSEMARREALIAPILFAVCGHIDRKSVV